MGFFCDKKLSTSSVNMRVSIIERVSENLSVSFILKWIKNGDVGILS